MLNEARPVVEERRRLKKEIKSIQQEIINDKDESGYGLEEIDNEIVRNRGIYDDAVFRREEALKQFQRNIEPEIRKEVEDSKAETMERLYTQRDELYEIYRKKSEEFEALDTYLQTNYAAYIGRGNLNERKINELIDIISSGKASNVMEALELQRGISSRKLRPVKEEDEITGIKS